MQYAGLNSLCFACRRIGHRKEGCLALIRKPDPSPECRESNEQPCNLTSSGAMSQEEEPRDGEEHEKEEYGDWMVVKKNKRPTRGNSRYPTDTLGATDRIGVMSTQRAPRDVNSDNGRDGKRKANSVDGVSELRVVNSQPLWPNCNQHPETILVPHLPCDMKLVKFYDLEEYHTIGRIG